jgi:SAM-dependent methyltransferase
MFRYYSDRYYQLVNWAGDVATERWRTHAGVVHRYKQRGQLLDIGCSNGSFLSAMKSENWNLAGVEISAASAEKARLASGATVFTGDILNAPLAPESFDVVTSFDVLEHLYQPRETMEKIAQWLKPGGIFYVVLPNLESWEARLFRSYWFGLELPRHLGHFSPTSLRHLAHAAGLKEESLTTPAWSYVEYSLQYLCRDMLRSCGLSVAISNSFRPSLPWRVVRKMLRLTVFSAWAHAASWAAAGPSMEAVFRKPLTKAGSQ